MDSFCQKLSDRILQREENLKKKIEEIDKEDIISENNPNFLNNQKNEETTDNASINLSGRRKKWEALSNNIKNWEIEDSNYLKLNNVKNIPKFNFLEKKKYRRSISTSEINPSLGVSSKKLNTNIQGVSTANCDCKKSSANANIMPGVNLTKLDNVSEKEKYIATITVAINQNINPVDSLTINIENDNCIKTKSSINDIKYKYSIDKDNNKNSNTITNTALIKNKNVIIKSENIANNIKNRGILGNDKIDDAVIHSETSRSCFKTVNKSVNDSINEPTKMPVRQRLATWKNREMNQIAQTKSVQKINPIFGKTLNSKSEENKLSNTTKKLNSNIKLDKKHNCEKTNLQLQSSTKIGPITQAIHQKLTEEQEKWKNNPILEDLDNQRSSDIFMLNSRLKNDELKDFSQNNLNNCIVESGAKEDNDIDLDYHTKNVVGITQTNLTNNSANNSTAVIKNIGDKNNSNLNLILREHFNRKALNEKNLLYSNKSNSNKDLSGFVFTGETIETKDSNFIYNKCENKNYNNNNDESNDIEIKTTAKQVVFTKNITSSHDKILNEESRNLILNSVPKPFVKFGQQTDDYFSNNKNISFPVKDIDFKAVTTDDSFTDGLVNDFQSNLLSMGYAISTEDNSAIVDLNTIKQIPINEDNLVDFNLNATIKNQPDKIINNGKKNVDNSIRTKEIPDNSNLLRNKIFSSVPDVRENKKIKHSSVYLNVVPTNGTINRPYNSSKNVDRDKKFKSSELKCKKNFFDNISQGTGTIGGVDVNRHYSTTKSISKLQSSNSSDEDDIEQQKCRRKPKKVKSNDSKKLASRVADSNISNIYLHETKSVKKLSVNKNEENKKEINAPTCNKSNLNKMELCSIKYLEDGGNTSDYSTESYSSGTYKLTSNGYKETLDCIPEIAMKLKPDNTYADMSGSVNKVLMRENSKSSKRGILKSYQGIETIPSANRNDDEIYFLRNAASENNLSIHVPLTEEANFSELSDDLYDEIWDTPIRPIHDNRYRVNTLPAISYPNTFFDKLKPRPKTYFGNSQKNHNYSTNYLSEEKLFEHPLIFSSQDTCEYITHDQGTKEILKDFLNRSIPNKDILSTDDENIVHNKQIYNIKTKSKKMMLYNLEEELNREESTLRQTSRALDLCLSKKSIWSRECIDCHRILLISAKRREAILYKIKEIRDSPLDEFVFDSNHSRRLDACEIRLPLKPEFLAKLGTVHDTHIYFVILTIGTSTEIMKSSVVNTKTHLKHGCLEFTSPLTLFEISTDFDIQLNVYLLAVPRNLKYQSSKKLKAIIMADSKTKNKNKTCIRASLFVQEGNLDLSTSSLNKTHFALQRVSYKSPLSGTIHMKLKYFDADLALKTGYMKLLNRDEGERWVNRFFVLDQNYLHCWKSDKDEKNKNPLISISLRYCVSDRLCPLAVEKRFQKDTFELVIIKDINQGRTPTRLNKESEENLLEFWFTCVDEKECSDWCNSITNVVSQLRKWHPYSVPILRCTPSSPFHFSSAL